MHHSSMLWFHLTGKSQHVIIILGALAILGIHQNIIHQFLVWTVSPKFSPSKLFYHTTFLLLCILLYIYLH